MNDRHPGDEALKRVLNALPSIYSSPQERTEDRLRSFLRPKLNALQPRTGEKPTDYRMRIMGAFSGPRWVLLRRIIAQDFTRANGSTIDEINNGLVSAFAAGMNESAYVMALSGVEMWPITEAIVAGLENAKVISLPRRKLKRGKDTSYNEQRLKIAVRSAVFQVEKPEEIPRKAAFLMAKARKSEMISAARASIYGASDSGAYLLGREAQHMGLDVEETWLAIMDMNVRTSHKHLHGTTIKVGEKFHGLYGDLRYPHDPEAPPQETYRCRCRMAVHLAGKSPGEYSRELLPTQTSAYRKWRDAQIRKAGGEVELEKLHRRWLKG